jgi:GMP synthase (glutamine-hydrolysing)
MKVHVFQHVPFEDLAGMEPWLLHRGHTITVTRMWTSDVLPDPEMTDCLIVMGGPMGAYDDTKYPWLRAEKLWIEKAIPHGKPILGICLGAQIVASVLGARVFPHTHKEIGWYPVTPTAAGATSPWLQSARGGSFTAFHWHGDTFDLPRGSVHLARTAACENQAFSYGDHVLGLQYHVDSTEESIGKLIANCADDLTEGPYVQTEEQIRKGLAVHLDPLSSCRSHLLRALTAEIEVR